MATDRRAARGNHDVASQVAALAALLYAGEMGYDEFLAALPTVDHNVEDDVAELLDLIEHEPKRGGFLGASHAEHDAHMADIWRLINRIRSDGGEHQPSN